MDESGFAINLRFRGPFVKQEGRKHSGTIVPLGLEPFRKCLPSFFEHFKNQMETAVRLGVRIFDSLLRYPVVRHGLRAWFTQQRRRERIPFSGPVSFGSEASNPEAMRNTEKLPGSRLKLCPTLLLPGSLREPWQICQSRRRDCQENHGGDCMGGSSMAE